MEISHARATGLAEANAFKRSTLEWASSLPTTWGMSPRKSECKQSGSQKPDCANGSVETWLRTYGERDKEGPGGKKKKTKERGAAQTADLFEPEQ